MNLEQQKERALKFLKNFEKPDTQVFADLIADDFEFEMMGRLPGVAPTRGKEAFLKSTPAVLKAMFPNGLNMKFHSTIAEGSHVAIQAESDTTACQREEIRQPVSLLLSVQGRQDRAGSRVQRHQSRARSFHELIARAPLRATITATIRQCRRAISLADSSISGQSHARFTIKTEC